jgi:hydantoinase/carbamoylase family amidase
MNDFSSGHEVLRQCHELAGISEDPTCLTRTFLTPEHKKANDLVGGWMVEAGMTVRTDAVGNVIGRYEGSDPDAPAVMIGSHLDTVPNAGRYDGMLGVILPTACIAELNRHGERLPFAVEVVAFGDEEGTRFGASRIGSTAIAGTLPPEELERTDANGISVAQAFREFGLDPERIGDAARDPKDFRAYLEIHIEQGPVLEAKRLPVGVVTAIAGATRMTATFKGEAGHAGTVPMTMRRDTLAGASEAVLLVEKVCQGDGLVGTVGHIEALPGGVNVIPGQTSLTIDMRSGDDAARQAAVAEVRAGLDDIAARRNLGLDVAVLQDVAACTCAPHLRKQLANAVEGEGVTAIELPSGAGHDAMSFSGLIDVAMLFVRCEGGISHNPAEAITAEDVDVAARVLTRALRNFH